MPATHSANRTVSNALALYLALDLGLREWKLAFTVGLGQQPRLKTIRARSTMALLEQIKAAKKRFGLPEDAAVLCCYEAGRDGFWLHRRKSRPRNLPN
jgi:transposase